MSARPAIRNKTWVELEVGDSASLERTCGAEKTEPIASAVLGNVLPGPGTLYRE